MARRDPGTSRIQYDKVLFILDPTEEAQAAIGKRLTVVDYPDVRLSTRHRGADLPYRTCAMLVSYVSRLMTLLPGDIIAIGTPPGVGMGKKPKPIYLTPGDVVTRGIARLCTQHSARGAVLMRRTTIGLPKNLRDQMRPRRFCLFGAIGKSLRFYG
jgi:Fumarylacetoacetate (FAA) hydrolase family